jgi:mannose-6-phosphate isomerase-like protein (cupin superfamily)
MSTSEPTPFSKQECSYSALSGSSRVIAPPLAGNILGSTRDDFVVAEWRDGGEPPGPPRLIAPLHVHHRDDEAWYVLEGTLHVQLGEDVIEAHAGSGVFGSRGTAHTYWNPGPSPVRYLLIMTSNILSLIQEIHTLQDRTPATLAAVFEKHNSSLVVPGRSH